MTHIVAEVAIAIGSSLVLSLIVKATVVCTGALIAARIARHCRAAVRHLLSATAFVVLLVLPFVSVALPAHDVALSVPDSSQTFPMATLSPLDETATASSSTHSRRFPAIHSARGFPSTSAVLLMVWLTGVTVFLVPMIAGLVWVRRMRQTCLPWHDGQVVVAELAAAMAVRRRIQLRLNEAVMGPMTCGVVRPVIILPPDARTWGREDLRRAIVHELEHISRGDWLMLCIGRVVCAVYWLHPLVWTLWRQLRLDAERACDDAVLRRSEPEAYAEQLLTLAERFASSRIQSLLAMANRSDLSARVTAVLDDRQPRGRAGSLWIGTVSGAAFLLLAGVAPLRAVAVAGQASAGLRFEVASVKPNRSGADVTVSSDADPAVRGVLLAPAQTIQALNGRLTMRNVRLRRAIEWAYGIQPYQLSGPNWLATERYDIDAIAERPVPEAQVRLMLQSLLAERFKLAVHREHREMPVYALVVARNGHRLQQAAQDGESGIRGGVPPVIVGTKTSALQLAEFLWRSIPDRPVLDQTGLQGEFDFKLDLRPFFSPNGAPMDPASTFGAALEEQLGLRLNQQHGNVEILVVDHVEPASEN